ncbi:hypothetical protein K491DRAFT_745997 [Lophiostoma macrostomum CBS 122681]|uniref:AB hydrolase-1 domain-containing protein n=1 Tax=Lophiostoma macrostomum CBS 122681 TaxID=1314788 RepID=A0A6A6TB87_9PLEO|nr:hypothetical protein K491DRAFT_745997 [Lophiostoma macrostomum CBS 122681]
MANPTIAIIAGATVTMDHYASLRKDIDSKGYPTVCHNPPSITMDDATMVTVDVDVAFVRNTLLAPLLSGGKDVILLCHSYGGTYGAGAVQGLSKRERVARSEMGGVVGIIYIASFCTEPGESTMEALGLSELPAWLALGEKPGTLYISDAATVYPSLSSEEANYWCDRLRMVAATAVATPISYAPYKDPAYDKLIAFVHAERDSIITPVMRDRYLERSGIRLTRSVQAGHGIDQEAREEVLRVVGKLAAKFK